MSATATAESKTQLARRRLILTRSLWIVVFTLVVGLYLFNLPYQVTVRNLARPGGGGAGYGAGPQN